MDRIDISKRCIKELKSISGVDERLISWNGFKVCSRFKDVLMLVYVLILGSIRHRFDGGLRIFFHSFA